MSALVRKEIRLILPFWSIAIFLAVAPAWIAPRGSSVSGMDPSLFWAFGFGMVLLGMAPFGQEFSLGTFSSLLAQPVERQRIWRTKTLLIMVAMLLVFIAFMVSVHFRLDMTLKEFMAGLRAQRTDLAHWRMEDLIKMQRNLYVQEGVDALETGFLLMFVAITGALWTSLLFRQTGAALWFAILVPGAIFLMVQLLFHAVSGQMQEIVFVALLSLYSIAGFVWARRMFLQAQDAQWLGETISVIGLSSAKERADSTAARGRKPLSALFRKEIQSHQISFLIAFGLLVLHGATLVFRKFYPLTRSSELQFAVEAVPLLWLLVAWLIGGVAVAEERKLGTMESQLCLPVTRRLQFAIKFAVVLLLGVLLGGLMPSLIEFIGTLAGISSEIVKPSFQKDSGIFFATVLEMPIAAGAIATISFFASTLTRNTLHALGAAIVFGGGFVALFSWVDVERYGRYGYSLWQGPLIFIVGCPVAIIAVIWLSFSNYKWLDAGRKIWLRSVFVLSVSLVFTGIAVAFVYQRPWELAIAMEPHRGPARLAGSVRPSIYMPVNRIIALLPDGRLWLATNYQWRELDRYEEVWDKQGQTNRLRKQKAPIPTGGMFVAGSNWVALAANDQNAAVAALQSDGTLWQILSWKPYSFSLNHWLSLTPIPRRIGSDSDWKVVAASGSSFLAVKTDGTLWGWGGNGERWFGTNADKYVAAPVRIGTDSDWAGLFAEDYGYSTLLMKRDGSIWIWAKADEEGGVKPIRVELNGVALDGSDWLAVAVGNGDQLVVRRDNTLWAWGYRSERVFGFNTPGSPNPGMARLGSDSDWMQISGDYWNLSAIKGGRLEKNGTTLFQATLGQPSRCSDWLTINSEWDQLVALAADGTVSMWKDTRGGGWTQTVLAPTHRPFWSFNIFSNSELTDSRN
jgi:alpha-tubulin suppressor-like RCC1 family protein